jgi:hypothetical protein
LNFIQSSKSFPLRSEIRDLNYFQISDFESQMSEKCENRDDRTSFSSLKTANSVSSCGTLMREVSFFSTYYFLVSPLAAGAAGRRPNHCVLAHGGTGFAQLMGKAVGERHLHTVRTATFPISGRDWPRMTFSSVALSPFV